MSEALQMDIHQVMAQLPHRYPFLLVDKVLECRPGDSLIAVKNVTINEPYFAGHFPHRPVMPGVIILEALAQATGLLAFATVGSKPDANTLYYFVGIDKARFKKPVEPGDVLTLKVKLKRTLKGVWCFDTVAEVDGRVVAKAEIMAAPAEFTA
jgi:3-hydroxyacyl-[acyl-carrier-protein] dehydratase